MNSKSQLTTKSPEDVWHFRSSLSIFDIKILVFKLCSELKWWKCIGWKIVFRFLSLNVVIKPVNFTDTQFALFYYVFFK